MKISIEFENAEKFFTELPKFAALIGFYGEFANFTHVKRSDLIANLEDPDLPKILEGEDGSRILRGAEEQIGKVRKAAKPTPKREEPEPPEAAPGEATAAADKGRGGEAENPKAEKETASEPPKTAPDITEVRQVLHTVIKAGHKDEVKALLSKLGAQNVTGLDPARYEEFIAEAGKIGGANA